MTEETWAPFSTWNAKEYVTCFRAVWSIYVGHCAPLLSPEGGQLLPHGRTSLIRSHSLAAGFALLHWSFHYTQLTSAPLWTPLPQPLSPCLDVHSHPCPLAPGAVTFSVKWESRTSSSAFCPGRASHNVGLLTGSHSFSISQRRKPHIFLRFTRRFVIWLAPAYLSNIISVFLSHATLATSQLSLRPGLLAFK